jgi:hypothetical protein
MLVASGTWGPRSGGVFWSNLRHRLGRDPVPRGDLVDAGRPNVRREPSPTGCLRPAASAPPPRRRGRPRPGRSGRRTPPRRTPSADAHDLERLQERLETEPAGGAREPAGRQDVRRTGRVVAHDRRAPEDRAGVADAREQAVGLGDMGSRCSGAYASDRASASSSVATRSTRTFGTPDTSTSTAAASSPPSVSRSASCPHRARPGRADRPRRPRRRARVGDHEHLAGAGRRSMRTRLETRSLAAVTYALPGPTIASTELDQCSVP